MTLNVALLNVEHGACIKLVLLQSHFSHTVAIGTRVMLLLLRSCQTLVGQDKPIRTKLLKPQRFRQDKDWSDAEPYKADENDGVRLSYVMVNLFRDIS